MCATTPQRISSSVSDDIKGDASVYNNKLNVKKSYEKIPTILCVLVMIDMLSVSLVVPLLHQYYKNAGVHSASQREMLSSLYSSSQIAGGLIIGLLSDLGYLSRRRILFLSFIGSALSYAMIVAGSLPYLVFSRVCVGLVKQTMTVSTSLLAKCTTADQRSVAMGRIIASSTVAWIIGPSFGAILYKHISPSAPALTASGLFVLNSLLAYCLLPSDIERDDDTMFKSKTTKKGSGKFITNLKQCFSCSVLASVVISNLLFGWVTRTTSYSSMSTFYEEKYDVEPHVRGYLKSYQQLLNFIVQSFLLRALLTQLGGERKAACIAAVILAGATLCEVDANFQVFISIVNPLVAVSVGLIGVSLRSLLTQVAPKDSIGSVLAALDVLQNAASVSVPFYRTFLFKLAATYGKEDVDADMIGDPEPRVWLLSSFLHWSLFAVVLMFLLLPKAAKGGEKVDSSKKNR